MQLLLPSLFALSANYSHTHYQLMLIILEINHCYNILEVSFIKGKHKDIENRPQELLHHKIDKNNLNSISIPEKCVYLGDHAVLRIIREINRNVITFEID